jgi:hypothetical protein
MGFFYFNNLIIHILIGMELISISNLTNPYPQPGNYIKTSVDEITLFGLYSDKNKFTFTLEDLSEVTPIENTTFRFIISVSNDEFDVNDAKLFTSKAYYDDLLLAYNDNNPYFINYSFNEIFIVNMNLERFINTFNPLNQLEIPYGIYVKRNIFITDEKEILYDKLIQYIDWLVSIPTLEEIDTEGVIPYYELSDYTGGRFNTDTLKWGNENDVIKEIKIKDIEDELIAITSDITNINNYLKNPNKENFNLLGFAVNNAISSAYPTAVASASTVLGAGSVSTIIAKVGSTSILKAVGVAAGLTGGIGVAVVLGVAAVGFIKGLTKGNTAKKKAADELVRYINLLRNELGRLERRKIALETELLSLRS